MSVVVLLACMSLQADRLPVPAKADRDRVAAEIRDLFKEKYAKRDAATRRALARTLLDEALRTRNKPVSLYVLLAEARDLAAAVGDVETTIAAIGGIAHAFDLARGETEGSRTAMKVAALNVASRSTREPEASGRIAEALYETAREGLDTGDFAIALEAARYVARPARTAKRPDLAKNALALIKRITALGACRINNGLTGS